ncbi:MAG: EF-hand domain-containing protein [Nitrospiraceae bacterium]
MPAARPVDDAKAKVAPDARAEQHASQAKGRSKVEHRPRVIQEPSQRSIPPTKTRQKSKLQAGEPPKQHEARPSLSKLNKRRHASLGPVRPGPNTRAGGLAEPSILARPKLTNKVPSEVLERPGRYSTRLDRNRHGHVDAFEHEGATERFRQLDKNHDGFIDPMERILDPLHLGYDQSVQMIGRRSSRL